MKAENPVQAPSAEQPKKAMPWLWIGLVALVLVAGGIAIVSSGDDEVLSVGTVPTGTDAAGTVPAGTTPALGESKGEVWPVTITGTPLDPLGAETDTAVGQQAPQLSGFTFDGSPVVVDPSKGPVMLVFLAHWCPHCNREIPELLKWKDSGAVPDDLQVIAVATAVNPDRDFYPPSSWIVDKGWTWPVLADSETSEAAQAMGVSGFPFSVIIGEDGTVLGRSSGELGQDGIQAWVDATLA
jgi:cytochrome c biogenesis protein CcmG, thiol:disulfide interchange protein DsbE